MANDGKKTSSIQGKEPVSAILPAHVMLNQNPKPVTLPPSEILNQKKQNQNIVPIPPDILSQPDSVNPKGKTRPMRVENIAQGKTSLVVHTPMPEKSVPPKEKLCEKLQVEKRYTIVRKLGEGAMGIVYLVYDQALGRQIALKTIQSSDEDIASRFSKEAQILAALYHPNIIPLYDYKFYKEEGSGYFTMMYVKGKNLQKWIEDHPEKEERIPKVAKMICLVADALGRAHERKITIIHRDIKPANILVDETDTPFVSDFGLAGLRATTQTPAALGSQGQLLHLTQVGALLGTPLYMSPEQTQCKELDGRSDIYSLGTTLCQALAGSPPFHANSQKELFSKIQNKGIDFSQRHFENIPQELLSICRKATAINKDNRYQTGFEFARDLQRYLDGEEVQAVTSRAYKFKKYVSRHKIKAMLLVFALLTLLSSLLFSYHLIIAQGRAEREKRHAEAQKRLAEAQKEIAEIQRNIADEQKNKAILSQVEAKLSEAEGRIARVTSIILVMRDYFAAHEENQKVSRLCKESEEILKEIAILISKNLVARETYQGLMKKYLELDKKSRHLARYQILPMLPAIIEKKVTSWPQALTTQPSWNFVALQKKENEIVVWDMARDCPVVWADEQKQKQESIVHPFSVRYVAFSPKDSFFATGDKEGNVMLWDLFNKKFVGRRQLLRELGHDTDVRTLVFDCQNRYLMAMKYSETSVWSIPDMAVPKELSGVKLPAGKDTYSNRFSPNGQWFAIGASESSAHGAFVYPNTYIWKVGQWKEEPQELWFYGKVLAFDEQSNYLAIATKDSIAIHSLLEERRNNRIETKQKILEAGHEGEILNLAFSHDGRFLASLGKDQKINIRDVKTTRKILSLSVSSTTFCIQFHPGQSDLLGVWSKEGIEKYSLEPTLKLKCEDMSKNKVMKTIMENFIIPRGGEFEAMNTAGLKAGLKTGPIQNSSSLPLIAFHIYSQPMLWKNQLGQKEQVNVYGKQGVKSLESYNVNLVTDFRGAHIKEISFSQDGTLMACVRRDSLEVWGDIDKEKLIVEMKGAECKCEEYGHPAYVGNCIAFHPTRKDWLILGSDHHIQSLQFVENSEDQACLKSEVVNTGNINSVCWDSQANLIAETGTGGTRIWKAGEGIQSAPQDLPVCADAICFSPDSKSLAVGLGCNFELWELERRKMVSVVKFPSPIKKITVDAKENLYWVIADRMIFVYDPSEHLVNPDQPGEKNATQTKIKIYPLEIYPGYLKTVAAVSYDFRHVAFLSSRFEIFLFDLLSPRE